MPHKSVVGVAVENLCGTRPKSDHFEKQTYSTYQKSSLGVRCAVIGSGLVLFCLAKAFV